MFPTTYVATGPRRYPLCTDSAGRGSAPLGPETAESRLSARADAGGSAPPPRAELFFDEDLSGYSVAGARVMAEGWCFLSEFLEADCGLFFFFCCPEKLP